MDFKRLKNHPNFLNIQERICLESINDAGFTLDYESDILSLHHENFGTFFCDFLSEKYLKEVRQNYARSENVFSFLKPLGKSLKVLDLTAGFGRDLFKFVLAGHEVTGYEKNPLVYSLLEDGLRRFQGSEKVSYLQEKFKTSGFRCDLHLGSFQDLKEHFDVVYYDPMFLDNSKKAAPKKHMQILKNLTATEPQGFPLAEVHRIMNQARHFVCKSSQNKIGKEPKFVKKAKGYSYYVF